MKSLLERIFNKFQVSSKFESYQELNLGHINETFLIKALSKPNYVLQKINSNVFSDAINLVTNKVLVSNFIQSKYQQLNVEEISKKVLCFVKAKDSTFFYKDTEGNIWNLSIFIENSIIFLKPPNSQIAFEAGKVTGEFLAFTKDFDVSKLTNILPDFHSVTKRYNQFKEALTQSDNNKTKQAKKLIYFVENSIVEMQQIDIAIKEKRIPLRLTHSDTKISNILFSKENKALCLIDTDTVMAGVLHFDYGDAIRTICNTEDEDSINLEKLDFNFDYFKSYTKGFFQEIKEITKPEIDLLPLSIKMMPFIMGMRFLTDFLNGNTYYKTSYENHNFDRANNQFTLVKRIDKKYSEIKLIFKEL